MLTLPALLENMKKRLVLSVFAAYMMLLSACKSEFEKIRTSGDVMMLSKKSLEYYDKKEYSKAQVLMELVMPNIKGQAILEEISYKYSYTHFYLSSYESASFYFKNFANTFGTSQFREEAEYMSAYSLYKQSPNYRLDQDPTNKAVDGFQAFINNFPDSKRIKECNKLIDELRSKLEKKALAEGELYYNLQQYSSSIQVFENMLKEFPETKEAERVRFTILKASYLLAENSIYEKQLERYRAVVDKYNDFKYKFPKSAFQKEAQAYLEKANKQIQTFVNVKN